MNADHRDSLSHYLVHYARVHPSFAASAQLEDCTVADMKISYATSSTSRTTVTIPFTPPLQSLSEARARLIQMNRDALIAQGMSPFQVKHFLVPDLIGILAAIGTIFGLYSLWFPANLAPDAWITRYILFGNKELAAWMVKWHLELMAGIVFIHGTECMAMGYFVWKHCPRITGPFGIQIPGSVGFLWLLAALTEGFPAINRLKADVKKKEDKEKK